MAGRKAIFGIHARALLGSLAVASVAPFGVALGAVQGASAPSPVLADRAQSFDVIMSGGEEVPGPGDPDGSGVATIRIRPVTGELCYTLSVKNTDAVTAAHIHSGAAGVAGPPIVTLSPPVSGTSDACVAIDPALATAITAAPQDYFVNIHSSDHPFGAVRGQLR